MMNSALVTELSLCSNIQVLLLTITGSSGVPENDAELLPDDAGNCSNCEQQQNDAGKRQLLISSMAYWLA